MANCCFSLIVEIAIECTNSTYNIKEQIALIICIEENLILNEKLMDFFRLWKEDRTYNDLLEIYLDTSMSDTEGKSFESLEK